jgi:hypothetical protein
MPAGCRKLVPKPVDQANCTPRAGPLQCHGKPESAQKGRNQPREPPGQISTTATCVYPDPRSRTPYAISLVIHRTVTGWLAPR